MEKCATLMNNEQEMKSHQSDHTGGGAGVGIQKTLNDSPLSSRPLPVLCATLCVTLRSLRSDTLTEHHSCRQRRAYANK